MLISCAVSSMFVCSGQVNSNRVSTRAGFRNINMHKFLILSDACCCACRRSTGSRASRRGGALRTHVVHDLPDFDCAGEHPPHPIYFSPQAGVVVISHAQWRVSVGPCKAFQGCCGTLELETKRSYLSGCWNDWEANWE